MSVPPRRRTHARMLAVGALCALDAQGDEFINQLSLYLQDTQLHVEFGLEPRLDPETLSFARRLAEGAWRGRERADRLIQASSPNWSVSRLSPVDRNVLRVGLYELLEEPETPHEIVLNEAVELARLLGSAESPAFVNGVLDDVRKRTDAFSMPPESVAPSAS